MFIVSFNFETTLCLAAAQFLLLFCPRNYYGMPGKPIKNTACSDEYAMIIAYSDKHALITVYPSEYAVIIAYSDEHAVIAAYSDEYAEIIAYSPGMLKR